MVAVAKVGISLDLPLLTLIFKLEMNGWNQASRDFCNSHGTYTRDLLTSAKGAMITDIILNDFGICEVTSEASEPSQASITGYFLESDTIAFLLKTDTIQLQKGLRFGMEYSLRGIEEENAEVFDVQISYPLLINPTTGESSVEVIETKAGCIGESNFDYFYFEHGWEMQPGKWCFQVIQSGRLLVEKEFSLYL
ncbi:hypothetical protein GCM10028819_02320 [Spirosoma humi]